MHQPESNMIFYISNGMAARWVLTLALSGAVLAATGCAASYGGLKGGEVTERISQASTPADHDQIASYYDAQAAEARQAAEDLRKRRRHYEHTPTSAYLPAGGGFGMIKHYDNLIDGQERNAREFASLAALHREMAKQFENTPPRDPQ